MYSWRELNSKIGSLSEQELLDLIEQELKGDQRTTVLVRLHQRYTMVRAMRERNEMIEKLFKNTTPHGVHC